MREERSLKDLLSLFTVMRVSGEKPYLLRLFTMQQNVTKIGNFSHTPKRKTLLQKMVKQYLPVYRHTTLLDLCRTRCIQRIDGLERSL